ncbi:MAG: adenosylcobinamide-GDP ribazoletransferase [Selenomonadaceae bacterium]|nr:adenosylcobinamide-GDP ribazoletransferase [Selenomonadaceae bacterium]
MDSFFIGLQFLTRISIVKQTVWTEESFGKSVKYFPAVGAVLGLVYVIIAEILNLLTGGTFQMLTAAVILMLMVILTGGIHCDGFMDTMDGLFSGRDRERMLEIMKDSRVGAFGVVSFVMLSILEFAVLSELSRTSILMLIVAIYSAPIIGRLMMVIMIGCFPYARPEGMGKAFAEYTTRSTIILAIVEALILLSPLILLFAVTVKALLSSLIIALIFTLYFGRFATKKVGGVTGDIYGAVELISEALVLLSFLLSS